MPKNAGTTGCPGAIALTRAMSASTGGDPAVTAHVARCARCRAEWDTAKRLRELGMPLPWDHRAPAAVRVAAGLERRAHRPHRGKMALLGVVLALAAAAALVTTAWAIIGR